VTLKAKGQQIIYGWKKGTSWGTAVACGVGDGFLSPPWSMADTPELITDDCLGQAAASDATPGLLKVNGDMPPYLRFNDIKVFQMLACFMGTAGTPSTHAAGTLSKDHVLDLADDNEGLFGTLCGLLGAVAVEEVPSAKPSKITIKGDRGKPVTISISCIGSDLVTDSAVNTLGTFAAVTVLERANRSYAAQAVIRLNDQSGGALASPTDNLGWTSFELVLERKYDQIATGELTTGGFAPRDLVSEPLSDGMITGSLKLTFPRTSDAAARAAIRANTSKKCDITITGPLIETTIPYLITISLPHLKPKTYANPHKQGVIANTRDYEVLQATAAPAGMTGITKQARICLTNKITTDLLA
jgi:Phage tail tube protein